MVRLLLAGVIVVACWALPASAFARPLVVVWSGGLVSGAGANGVVLRPDGSGERLEVLEGGARRVLGRFSPHGAALASIRAAADDVLAHAPVSKQAPHVLDGSYVSVAVQDGKARKFVFDRNKDSAPVTTLLKRLDAVLPRGSRVSSATGAGFGARASDVFHPDYPSVGSCGPHAKPVSVSRDISLEQAVQQGVVTKLSSKGTVGGDSIGLDATWKPDAKNDGPITITLNMQVSSGIPGLSGAGAMQEVEQAYASDAARFTGSVGGEPVTLRFNLAPRAGDGEDPLPCYEQVRLFNEYDANGNSVRRPSMNALHAPYLPDSAKVPGDHAELGGWLAHVAGNMLDFPLEEYAVINVAGALFPLEQPPVNVVPGVSVLPGLPTLTDALLGASNVDPDAVRVDYLHLKADNDNVMANPLGRTSRLTDEDFANFLADNPVGLRIKAAPGTFLGNKHVGDQNYGVGATSDVSVPAHESVHVDGIVAYCLDLLGHGTPAPGADTFDVGPHVGDLGGEALQALQRVLEVVAAREPGPLEETPGANGAIWRVTDNLAVDRDSDPAAAAILDAAGVPLDPAEATFDTPHPVDPAAGVPYPVALASLTDATPLPLPPSAPVSAPPSPPGAKLTRLTLAGRPPRGPVHRAAPLLAVVQLTGGGDRVALQLTRRRSHRTILVAASRRRAVPAGATLVPLLVRRGLAPGRYRLTATAAHAGMRSIGLTVARKRGHGA